MACFADVVIPHTRLDALTYLVPEHLQASVKPGAAVRTELRQKLVTGIVAALRMVSDLPNPKSILGVVEPEFCSAELLRLTRWVSRYYIASWGETLTLAFPAGIAGYKPRKPWQASPVAIPTGTPPTLTLDQHNAVSAILRPLKAGQYRPFLLFGITGSGKTEIYLRAAEDALRMGKSVIVLVPEIVLTPLLISRFAERFPHELAALHSGLRPAERKKHWQALRDGKLRLVVGARSAVFAPVRNLGLIVVDEEHDHSYKEAERSPHYNARDVAVTRAKVENAVAVLASATPSIESFYAAQRGAYQLLELPKRINDRPLPKAAIVSLRRSGGRGQRRRTCSAVLSRPLESAIRAKLSSEEQIILFVSRRGFASQLSCADCGFVPTCRHCGIPLVFHADVRTLQCHFCRSKSPVFELCPRCSGDNFQFRGVGTQQVVQELTRLFPEQRVLRLDSDATAKPDAFRQILDGFGQGKARFLVGTQMVTKGFDFPRVTLCGVVSADSSLNLPDFRSAERTFQVLTQVAGRAGRATRPGQAIFQTLHPDHYALIFGAQQNFRRFYEEEVKLRRGLGYPPFTRLALFRIMSRDREAASQAGLQISKSLETHQGVEVLGPAPGYRRQKRNLHIQLLLAKARAGVSFSRIVDRSALDIPGVRVDLDIDPLDIA